MSLGAASNGLTGDTIAIFVLVIGALLSLVGTLSLLILNEIRRSVRDNTKHIHSLVTAYWMMLTRQTFIEDHLHERDGYKAPRIMEPEHPPGF